MPPRLANVDALRGFAALWVFTYHLWNVFAGGYSPQGSPADHKPLNADTPVGVIASYPLFAYGYTGVGLFFVLSGFCIHLPQARRFHRTGSDTLEPRPFFRRRFRRLYPAFFASLFLSLAGLVAMGYANDKPELLNPAAWVVLLLTNACFLLAIRPDALALNGVYWTLWYEVQFYLAYPLLLKICRRVGFGGVAAGLLGIELLFCFVPVPEVLQPFAKHFEWFFLRRYFEWFLGMWLAERAASGVHLPRWGSIVVAVAAGMGGVICSHTPSLWAGHEILLAVASAGVLSLLVSPNTANVGGPLTWCGDWSYSLYLVHMPMLRLLNAALFLLPESVREAWAGWIFGASAVVSVPLVAWVWYRLFEKPFLPKPTPTGERREASPPVLVPG
ncbi:MAG: acyltransferase [Fimbriiglobus sp.]|nr:acyltransferase [Fimbriiglobus sp.]